MSDACRAHARKPSNTRLIGHRRHRPPAPALGRRWQRSNGGQHVSQDRAPRQRHQPRRARRPQWRSGPAMDPHARERHLECLSHLPAPSSPRRSLLHPEVWLLTSAGRPRTYSARRAASVLAEADLPLSAIADQLGGTPIVTGKHYRTRGSRPGLGGGAGRHVQRGHRSVKVAGFPAGRPDPGPQNTNPRPPDLG